MWIYTFIIIVIENEQFVNALCEISLVWIQNFFGYDQTFSVERWLTQNQSLYWKFELREPTCVIVNSIYNLQEKIIILRTIVRCRCLPYIRVREWKVKKDLRKHDDYVLVTAVARMCVKYKGIWIQAPYTDWGLCTLWLNRPPVKQVKHHQG